MNSCHGGNLFMKKFILHSSGAMIRINVGSGTAWIFSHSAMRSKLEGIHELPREIWPSTFRIPRREKKYTSELKILACKRIPDG